MKRPSLPYYPKTPPDWWNEDDYPYSWEELRLEYLLDAERDAMEEMKQYESEEDE